MTWGGRRYVKYQQSKIDEVLGLRGTMSAYQASIATGVSRRYINNLWREEFRR